jgi:DNA mismatch endonuclease (patch repair protein)
MQRVRRTATGPELRLRSAFAAEGLLGEPHGRLPLPRRRADLIFPEARVAVFVDGCWWHGCPEHFRPPVRNRAWWLEKVEGNRARDAETDALLEDLGWRVARIWEHDPPAKALVVVLEWLRG